MKLENRIEIYARSIAADVNRIAKVMDALQALYEACGLARNHEKGEKLLEDLEVAFNNLTRVRRVK